MILQASYYDLYKKSPWFLTNQGTIVYNISYVQNGEERPHHSRPSHFTSGRISRVLSAIRRKTMSNVKRKPKRGLVITAIVLLVIILLIECGFLAWKYALGTIVPEVTIEVGGSVTCEDFLTLDLPLPAELETDISSLDLSVPGDHTISIRYCWSSVTSTLKVRDTVSPTGTTQNLTVFSTQRPEASEFVTSVSDMTEVAVSYASEPDWTLEGDQTVNILLTDLGGNTATVTAALTLVFDETPPEITGVEEMKIYLGDEIDLLAGVSVTDDLDSAPVLTLDDSKVDLTQAGVYEVTYTAVDVCLNETVVTTTLTVIKDEQAPEILGVRPLSIFAGSTVSYRANVIVTDDTDSSPTLTVDSSKVDLSQAGTYPVIYKATDGAGNTTSVETTITVSEKPDSFVEESVIFEAADKVLAKITNDDMTTKAKVQAIYKWVLNNCWYSNHTDKTDYMQVAYQMLTKGSGDCFGFYSVTRLMFERLGIPNLTVQRAEGTSRSTTHYWSMVSVDGGETYYHFDSCPHPQPARNMCLVTDATLEWFNGYVKDYYTYDKSLYPATPEE